jgi:hypothetical protein
MAHPELDLLELHVLDRLQQSDNDVLEEHLLLCHHCRVASQAIENEVFTIRRALAMCQG